jgi:hypothetical protein
MLFPPRINLWCKNEDKKINRDSNRAKSGIKIKTQFLKVS